MADPARLLHIHLERYTRSGVGGHHRTAFDAEAVDRLPLPGRVLGDRRLVLGHGRLAIARVVEGDGAAAAT